MRKLRSIFATLILLLSFAGTAHAQIPVTDGVQIGTHISNQVETIAKWAQQYAQLQQQIQQYRQHYQSITGSRGMGSMMDGAGAKSTLPTDWKSVLSNVKNSPTYSTERAKFPTLTGMPQTNAMYDVIASQNATMSELYSQANARIQQVQSLMGQIDSASDPAAKQDLTNRLVSEQNAIQANQNLVAILQTKQKQDLEAASQAAAKEFTCKEFKKSNC